VRWWVVFVGLGKLVMEMEETSRHFHSHAQIQESLSWNL